MRRVRKDIAWIAAAFLLLFAVSLYRQIGRHSFPDDPVRPPIVYFVYLLLLTGWWVALRRRITQRNIRVFLLAEHACMLIGITIPFLIDAFLQYFTDPDIVLSSRNIFIMRLTGYSCDIPLILLPLFGFYASFGLGKPEEYRLNRKWYFLMIPAGILILLVLTNESHHLVYYAVENVQSVFNYDPNFVFFIMFAWAVCLLLIRIFIIYHRSREQREYKRLRIAPFAIAVFMLLYNIPFIAASFVMDVILIEYHISMFFLEIMVWESCFLIGMIPVNTHYEDVFDRSTVAMQIVDEEGLPRLKSADAPEISAEMFRMLKQSSPFLTPAGQELYLHKIRGGYAVWQNDVSRTIAVIDELRKSTEKLEYEGELLRQELKIRSDEEAVKEQTRIYNNLTDEVGERLALLRKLLGEEGSDAGKAALFRKICLIGTYIKRRCNLRLTQQSDDSISNNDLEICYHELMGCLRQMGVEADVLWYTANALDPEFAIFTLDALESLLEYERFDLRSIVITFETDAAFSIRVCPGSVEGHSVSAGVSRVPDKELQRINKGNYDIRWLPFTRGYQVSICILGR